MQPDKSSPALIQMRHPFSQARRAMSSSSLPRGAQAEGQGCKARATNRDDRGEPPVRDALWHHRDGDALDGRPDEARGMELRQRDDVSGETSQWRPALFKGKTVFVLCDADGAVMLDHGRVPMKYGAAHDRIYHAALANVTDPDGRTFEKSARPAPADASATSPSAKAPSGGKKRAGGAGKAPAVTVVAPDGAVLIYTDGACSGNPGGPAALGVVVEDGAHTIELGEYLADSGTNNLAELTAILRGLELAPEPAKTTVLHTDSKYALGVLVGGWKAKVHLALIASIKKRMQIFPALRLVYVPGHSGIDGNERADELARLAIEHRGNVNETHRRNR
jgi:ribonuclease HI